MQLKMISGIDAKFRAVNSAPLWMAVPKILISFNEVSCVVELAHNEFCRTLIAELKH